MEKDRDLTFKKASLAEILKEGSVVVIPTDTLPALATLPKYAYKIWEIKRRPFKKSLILMGASSKDLFKEIFPSSLQDASLISNQYWPGALTMVLPASGKWVSSLNKQEESIGLRVPNCQQTLELLELTGPLATTSANISGESPLKTPKEIARAFPGLAILGPLPWPAQSGLASTVIYWQGENNWKVLRSGEVTFYNNHEK